MIREYSSISVETTLSAQMTSIQTTMNVATGTGASLLGGITLSPPGTYQFTLAIDPDTSNEEIVFATANSGDTFTITRGEAGSTAITHSAGATVRHVLTSDDLDYFNTAIQPSILTGKGSLITSTASATAAELTTGTDGQVLTVDTTLPKGIKWSNAFSLPTQTGNSGKYLKTDGSSPSWQAAVATLDIVFNAQTGTSYTITSTDVNKLVTLDNASAITLTVPNGVFTTGQQINLQQLGAGQVTVASDGTTTISGTGTKLRTTQSAATLICTGTNTFTLIGDLA